jgi:predicted nucleic-acid-binding protein
VIALDTNVVVRFLVNDDPAQFRRARALIGHGDIFIAATVLLETEWVLRAGYGFRPSDIRRFLRALLGLPGVATNDPARIARALDAYEAGLDFADALHIALSDRADAFATFDGRLIRRGRNAPGPKPIMP